MRFAKSARVNSSQPGVMARKMGASPSGFTTGNKAPTISRIAPASWLKSVQSITVFTWRTSPGGHRIHNAWRKEACPGSPRRRAS